MTVLPVFLAALTLHWFPQTAMSTAGLRGLSVVSSKIVWTTGTHGTVLRTLDGGHTWTSIAVPGAESLDFRDVVAFNAQTALIMSSGPAGASRVYRTINGGQTWTLVLANPDKTGFFDAMKFWDSSRGLLLGDPVAGSFTIYITQNAGLTWVRATGPAALPNEGAFAASGSCLALFGQHDAWFGTGGPAAARVFHTSDAGAHWRVALTPLAGSNPSSGIFSLLFTTRKLGFAVGGDYQKPSDSIHTLALTRDGGLSWTTPGGSPQGFRSSLTYISSEKLLIAVGTTGSNYSLDSGQNWLFLSSDNLNAIAAHAEDVWAVGPQGRILKLAISP